MIQSRWGQPVRRQDRSDPRPASQWGNSGYETGPLGYPTTDELVAPDGTRRYNNFVGGSIVWSPADGAIADLYPVSDTLPTNPQPGSYGSYSMGLPVQGRVWTPQQVATEVVNHIDQYFTFTCCGPTLYVGKTCDLNTDIGVPAPIQVIAINSTGFAVKSLPNHPQGAGRTITFVIEANDVPGNLGLETLQVDAFGPLSNSSLAGRLSTEGTARPSWTILLTTSHRGFPKTHRRRAALDHSRCPPNLWFAGSRRTKRTLPRAVVAWGVTRC